MKIGFLIFLVIVASCKQTVGESSGLENVFGQDDRDRITSNDHPWRAVGKIDNQIGCTGTLISKSLILTAAHCVVDQKTGKTYEDLGYFIPNMISGQPYEKYKIVYAWFHTNDSNENRAKDWAIAKVDNAPGSLLGWIGVITTTVGSFPDKISAAGYSDDIDSGKTASIHHECNARMRHPILGVILHDCDSTKGSSGGPVLATVDDEFGIVGLMVSEKRGNINHSLKIPEYDNKYGNVLIPTHEMIAEILRLKNEGF